jgi:hypothetical protein
MANKKVKQKKTKQSPAKMSGSKGGSSTQDLGSPSPTKKRKK